MSDFSRPRKAEGELLSLSALAERAAETARQEGRREDADDLSPWVGRSRGATAPWLPVEWVIEVADERGRWHFGTAFCLHEKAVDVAIPDREEPVWEGRVPLAVGSFRLVECLDPHGVARSVYRTLLAMSAVPVAWRVRFFDDADGALHEGTAVAYNQLGTTLLVDDAAAGRRATVQLANAHVVDVGDDVRRYRDLCRLVEEGSITIDARGDPGTVLEAMKELVALQGLEDSLHEAKSCCADAEKYVSELLQERLKLGAIVRDLALLGLSPALLAPEEEQAVACGLDALEKQERAASLRSLRERQAKSDGAYLASVVAKCARAAGAAQEGLLGLQCMPPPSPGSGD